MRPTSLRIQKLLFVALLAMALVQLLPTKTVAQLLSKPPLSDKIQPLKHPSKESSQKEQSLIGEIYDPELLLRIDPTQTKILRTNYPILRTAISHPGIADIQFFSENEIEIIGKAVGETTLTFWYKASNETTKILRYHVVVDGAKQEQQRRDARYKQLQTRVNELFPNSQIFLFPIEDKVIVRGQARDAKEAAEIISVLTQNQSNFRRNFNGQFFNNDFLGGLGNNNNNNLNDQFDDGDSSNFINLLEVPGEHQIMLKVRVAELVRNANRSAGVDISAVLGSLDFTQSIAGGGNLTAILSDGDVQFFLNAISGHGYGKILAEPTLATISGKPARFLAGGEFAVPTTVGVGGVGAATTTFRGFGTELQFTPTLIDKDLVRMEVSPSFSTINSDVTVGGIPGLNLRSVDTTVDLREGQWLAIAGLIQDEQGGQRTKVPLLGDLPFLGGFFSSANTSRFETELVILVSPQLVHPLESEQVPLLLPGMWVTEATDTDFFVRNTIEGYQGFDHRSTIWPEIKRQRAGVEASAFIQRLTNRTQHRLKVQKAYLYGPSGFSK